MLVGKGKILKNQRNILNNNKYLYILRLETSAGVYNDTYLE